MKIQKDILDQIVSFETAKLAKQKAFIFRGRTNDWMQTTLPYHENGKRNLDFTYEGEDYPAPTQSLLQKWLRQKHKIIVIVDYLNNNSNQPYSYQIFYNKKKTFFDEKRERDPDHNDYFNKYEDALEIGLWKAPLLIKNK